jgi:valyl-tRNA synthetase
MSETAARTASHGATPPTPPPSPDADSSIPKNYEFVTVEPLWVERWAAERIYEYDPESPRAKAGKVYSVDTPPPYVSAAHLHVGHAMSYSQAEFVVRFKRMRGHEIFYPMGFDDNGLPTERYVEQKYKVNKAKVTRQEFIDLCLQETRAGAQVYQDLWKQLGLSVDWRMTYSTIQPRAVKHAQRSFLELVRSGHMERRADPILWCPTCGTALAQADVESGDEIDRPMHAVRFDVDPASLPAPTPGPHAEPVVLPESGVIETTRPELVTACVALACHPDDKRFAGFKGLRFRVPLTHLRFSQTDQTSDDGGITCAGEQTVTEQWRTVPLIFDPGVDPDFGTGLMMVCTFGDPEDIAKWRAHKLDTVVIVDPAGRMVTPNLPELNGKRVHVQAKGSSVYNEARLASVELLRTYGYLGEIRANVSRASVHERCSTPVEIQVAPQWFIRLLDLKEPLLARGRELRWHPEWMRERYEDWVTGLKWDWNISRQRFYGVPFPVWYCNACEAPVYAEVSELPVDPTMTASPRPCAKCGSSDLRPEPDVMDTWMTSSLTPLLNANWAEWDQKQPEGTPPADLARKAIYPMGVRVQAFEIIRTWLFYTVAKAHLHTGSLPWRDVMISGWGLDRQGKKMSKRAGNFVDPAEPIGKYSADALRYWAAGATLGHDLRYLEDDVKGGKRLLTKLWNSTRFAMQNVGAVHQAGQRAGSEAETPTPADLWIRSELVDAVQQATAAFETYEYNKAVRATEGFFWGSWCDNYLEIVKDRFRPGEAGSQERNNRFTPGEVLAAQNTLIQGTYTLLRLFAPVLPFITEELYHRAIKPLLPAGAPRSIHIAPWPEDEDTGKLDLWTGVRNPEAEREGALLVALVGAVRQARTAGKLGGGRPLEAIYVGASDALRAQIAGVEKDWLAASRADKLVYGAAPEGLALFDVGLTGIQVGIVAAVEVQA